MKQRNLTKMTNHLKSNFNNKRIMEITSKNANIYACCVLNESRLNELKGLLVII